MTFEEWWDSLDTREQNSTNYTLTKKAWQAALAAERERCIAAVQTLDDGPPIDECDIGYVIGWKNAIDVIRELGDKK